jgi:hypothetical protein
MSGAFLDRVDLVRHKAVGGLAVNGRRSIRRRRLDEAEHFAAPLAGSKFGSLLDSR